MGILAVLGISILFQLVAVFLALRLVDVTGKRKAWVLIAAAIFLMAVRRSITLFRWLSGGLTQPLDLAAESVALTISILMVAGIAGIAPLFAAIKRSEEKLQRHTQRLQVLHAIDQAIQAAQSPEAIAQAALRHIRQLVPCLWACIMMFDFEAGEVTRFAVDAGGKNDMRVGTRFPLESFEVTEELWHNKVCVVEDILALSQPDSLHQILLADGARSSVHAPLVVQDKLIGSLNLWAKEPGFFTSEHVAIAREVADSLAVALQSARLFEAERQQAAALARSNAFIDALGRVAARLQSSLDSERIIQTLGTELKKLNLGCWFAVLEPESQALVIQHGSVNLAALTLAEKLLGLRMRGFRMPLQHLASHKELIQQKRAVYVPDMLPRAIAMVPGHHPRSLVERVMRLAGITPDAHAICLPVIAGKETLGVLAVWGEELHEDDVPSLSIFTSQLAIALENARLFEQVHAGRQRLQSLARQLVEVQESERRHLARELHDQVGQTLTAVKINLQSLGRLPDTSHLAPHLEDSIAAVERALQQVRNLSLELRPAVLDDLGLAPALRWHLDRVAQQAGFSTHFAADPLEQRPKPHIETACFRIAQEALTNVVRHAGAHQVSVELRQRATELHLLIRDDGAGFDVETALERAVRGESLGLLGMKERVELVGGILEIDSAPGRGTEVRARFPLTPDRPLERRRTQR